ncbi:hypothetical protein M0804_013973 [Polistes exclamans]|nr:hypothetical protein M0804_013973 [Polistes exclamans]
MANYVSEALEMILTYSSNEEEKFYEWVNQFEYAANFIWVPNNKMHEFFYRMVNNNFQSNVRIVNLSVDFSKLSYEETLELYHQFFSSNTDTNLHRRRLFDRNQYKNEPIKQYADSLLEKYYKCNYKNIRKKQLCERFIRGIRNDNIRKYLNKTPELSFNEAVAKAIKFEKDNEITHYQNKAFSMIHTYSPKKEGLFYNWLNKFEYVAEILSSYRKIKCLNFLIRWWIIISMYLSKSLTLV